MAALDRGVEEEEIAKKVIGSTEVQKQGPEWAGMNTEKFCAENMFVNLF